MRCAIELPDVHDVVFVLEHGCFVVVDVEIVGCRENGHNRREARGLCFAVHAVSGILRFMSSNDGQKLIALEKLARSIVGEEVGATSHVVVDEALVGLFRTKVLEGVGPEDVAHETVCGGLAEAINAAKVIEGLELWRETTVNAEELLVHDGSEGKRAERLHAEVIDLFRILVLALELKGKVVGQVTTFVVATKEKERVRVPDLQCPEVEDALDGKVAAVDVIAQKEVAGVCGVATDFKELHEIIVLAVDIAADGDGSVDFEQVGFLTQDLGGSCQDEAGLVIGETALAIKVVLEEGNIGLGRVLCAEELLVGGFLECWCLYIFDDTLLGADLGSVVGGVDGKVDLGRCGLVGDLADGFDEPLLPVDLGGS